MSAHLKKGGKLSNGVSSDGEVYKFMPENPQACLWDERHPHRAGVFRGRQPSNRRSRQSFRTECGLPVKKPPSLLGGSSLLTSAQGKSPELTGNVFNTLVYIDDSSPDGQPLGILPFQIQTESFCQRYFDPGKSSKTGLVFHGRLPRCECNAGDVRGWRYL
jgi:hypothetical protein